MEKKYAILYRKMAYGLTDAHPFDLVPMETWKEHHTQEDGLFRDKIGKITLKDENFRIIKEEERPKILINRAGSFSHGPKEMHDMIRTNLMTEINKWCDNFYSSVEQIQNRFNSLEPYLSAKPDFYLLRFTMPEQFRTEYERRQSHQIITSTSPEENFKRFKEEYAIQHKANKLNTSSDLASMSLDFLIQDLGLSRIIAINSQDGEPEYDWEKDVIKVGDFINEISFKPAYSAFCQHIFNSMNGWEIYGHGLSLTKVGSMTQSIPMRDFLTKKRQNKSNKYPYFVQQDETFYSPASNDQFEDYEPF